MNQLTLFPQPEQPKDWKPDSWHVEQLKELCEVLGVECSNQDVKIMLDNLKKRK